jgi:hypothetical protein
MSELKTIGRAELIDVVDFGFANVPAKVDTGADSSSIWATDIREVADGLHFVLFGPGTPFYTGQVITTKTYTVTRVANSFGHKEYRYKVKLRVRIHGRLIRATFNLADRSSKAYPILLGRRLLNGKFLVDVAQGSSMYKATKLKSQVLLKELEQQAKEQA